MAFESNVFKTACKHKLPKSDFVVSCQITAEGEIAKVLCVSAQAMILSKEILQGSITYTGNIESCVVYTTENNEINSVTTSCPFTSKFEDEMINPQQNAVIRVCTKGSNVTNMSGNSLNVDFDLCQTGFVVCNDEIKTLSSNNTDIASILERVKVVKYVGEGKSTFCSETPLISREQIKKLLLTESQVQIKDVESGMGFVTISGEVVNRIVYLTEDDKFESGYIFESFKEEIEVEGVTRESMVEGGGFVRFTEVKAEVENNDKGAKIKVFVPVDLFAIAFEEEEVSVIKDLYSTKNELEIVTESFEMDRLCPFEMIEGKIDGMIVLDDDKPRVDKILFSGGNSLELLNISVEDDMLKVEGIAKTNVVYLNDDTNTINTAMVEIPFVLEDRVSIPENADLYAVATINDSDVIVKKGRELYFDAKIKVLVYADEKMQEAVISNISIKEELPQKDYAMEILFATKGQTSWDIGKACKVKEEIIKNQNSDLVFPLENDAEIVIFYQNVSKI